jgi:pyridoxal 5'-phosphate synthase pdxT subunit
MTDTPLDEPIVIGVLALQGAFAAHESVLNRLGVVTKRVRMVDDLRNLDGIVLPGGESTTMSNLLVSSGLFEPLADRLHLGLPVFGTCAGMILLASRIIDGREDQRSFGMIDISVRRNAYGRQIDSFETDLDIVGIGHQVPAVFIRAPAIDSIGPDVRVLSREGEHPCLVREGRALAASFHPELTTDTSVHEMFVTIVRESLERDVRDAAVSGNTVGASENEEK